MTDTLLILGEPGSGKSTLTKAFTSDWIELSLELKPVKHITYNSPYGSAIQLGWNRPPFSGTDTLGHTSINFVSAWYPEITANLVLAEGDRLANDRFVKLAEQHGNIIAIYLDTDSELAQERRIQRIRQHNLPTQNPSWIAGRRTKHLNLAERLGATRIPGDITPEEQANLLRILLS